MLLQARQIGFWDGLSPYAGGGLFLWWGMNDVFDERLMIT